MSMANNRITVIDGGKDGGGNSRRNGGGGSERDAARWQDHLILTKTGECKATAHNVMLILENDDALKGLFWLDEFANRVAMRRDPPWAGGTRDEFSESDATELCSWLGHPSRYSMPARAESVMQAVEAIARRARAHPVRDYLRSLKWDGTPRVEKMFIDLFGAEDIAYERGAAKCFMVSAVARILWIDDRVAHNGAKVDFMVVLESKQGKGKTSAVLELFGPQWYFETTESPATKDFYQALRGRWGVEIGEMDSFSKADVTKVKQAITSRFDHYRPSYGRYPKSFRRECVFIGTTNETEYLRDATGGRRFLPVRVGNVRIDQVKEQRDQLWAEAVELFESGFEWWALPADAEREQAARYSDDVWTDRIWNWLEGNAPDLKYGEIPLSRRTALNKINECNVAELLSYAIGVDVGRQDRPQAIRVGNVMARLKWPQYRPETSGSRVRYYYRPMEPADE